MTDFLVRMAERSRQRSSEAMALRPEAELLRLACSKPRPPPLRLSPEGFDLIAEVKRRSPAVGRLADDALSPPEQADKYATAGAAAISVLTEPDEFLGDLAHLEQVVERVSAVPAMRKDFLATSYQVIEGRAAGAGGVLLVVAMLTPDRLREMLETTLKLNMFALVEVFTEAELDVCAPVLEEFDDDGDGLDMPIVLGVNCRDLRNLDIDFARFEQFAHLLPSQFPWVAESGVLHAEQAGQVAALGYRLALVGTALMRAPDPVAAAQDLLSAGRRVAVLP